uniref:Uncharacterized protein n=1 Tax=Anguilla anguilla TaxID=7936 RepID=A0A0E9X0P2_ANGAN
MNTSGNVIASFILLKNSKISLLPEIGVSMQAQEMAHSPAGELARELEQLCFSA